LSNPLISIADDLTRRKHIKCEGYYDAHTGDYGCGYSTKLMCEECKYCIDGIGRKDPEAKCNEA